MIIFKRNDEMVVERVFNYAIILLNLSKMLYIVIQYISLVIFITFLIIILSNYLDAASKYLFE